MNGWTIAPLAAAIPERAIVFPPLLGDHAGSVLLLVLSLVLLSGIIGRRHHLQRWWHRRWNRPQLRPAHLR